MRNSLKDKRQAKGESWAGRETYPSQYAGSRVYPTDHSKNRGAPASELEPRAIRCAQCGLPIEDYGNIEACPSCGSDNYLGRDL